MKEGKNGGRIGGGRGGGGGLEGGLRAKSSLSSLIKNANLEDSQLIFLSSNSEKKIETRSVGLFAMSVKCTCI